jgi:uncharacterized protein
MKVNGTATLNAPRDAVWVALNDPAILVRTIPGCQQLEEVGPDAYRMTLTAGVASIKGTYTGDVALTDQEQPGAFTLRATGAGAPGTVQADVRVTLADAGDGTTRLDYDADAVVGGMIGGVGQRMLGSVSRRLAAEFFASIDDVLGGAAVAPVPEAATPGVFTAPVRPNAAASQPDFLKGVAVGAALVAAGVLLGVAAGRRR